MSDTTIDSTIDTTIDTTVRRSAATRGGARHGRAIALGLGLALAAAAAPFPAAAEADDLWLEKMREKWAEQRESDSKTEHSTFAKLFFSNFGLVDLDDPEAVDRLAAKADSLTVPPWN